jgi:hypothetical protein
MILCSIVQLQKFTTGPNMEILLSTFHPQNIFPLRFFFMMIPFFWDMMLHQWIISSWKLVAVLSPTRFIIYYNFLDILKFQDEGATLPWNMQIQLSIGTKSYPKIVESSATLLWKSQNSHPSLRYPPVTFTTCHMVSPPNFLYAILDSQSRHHSQLTISQY